MTDNYCNGWNNETGTIVMKNLIPTQFVILLAITSLLSGCNSSSNTSAAVDLQQINRLSQALVKDETMLSVIELSDWIIKDTRDFELIDIRNDSDFQIAHIKNAIHKSSADMFTQQGMNKLAKHKKLVVYSNTGQRSAQVATLLKLSGFNAFTLSGGYQQWLNYTANPETFSLNKDAHARARQQAVACYFEGDYIADAGLTVKQQNAGFTPPLVSVQTIETVEEIADPLGLGLGLGMDDMLEPSMADPAPTGLILGEGC
jgi:rhodanese-related sulfurtransferase